MMLTDGNIIRKCHTEIWPSSEKDEKKVKHIQVREWVEDHIHHTLQNMQKEKPDLRKEIRVKNYELYIYS
jgi:hypothetical protein